MIKPHRPRLQRSILVDYLTGQTLAVHESETPVAHTKPVVINVADVEARELKWLWPGMIPRGKLTVLCGDPGLGKSFITLDLASRASRGGPWPLGEDPPGDALRVLLLSAEDDPADTIRPRLENMGADLSKIDIIDAMIEDGDEDRVSDFIIGEHSRDLAQLLTAGDPVGLLVVDPVSAYVGGTDSYNNAQVRAMLKPLSDLAADHDVAVVLVTHMRKSEAAKALHAAMGSLAFTAAARVVLLVSRDKDDPEMRLLLTVKSNLASDRTGYRYKVEGGKVEWVEVVEGQADELLKGEPKTGKAEEKQRKVDVLVAELKSAMAAGPVPTDTVRKMALKAGVSWVTMQQPAFKSTHGFGSRKEGKGWVWFVK